jgi:hypothetical protein
MFPQRDKKKKPKSIFRVTPPPNYQARSVKIKVFAAAAIVIVIPAIVERSLDPQGWDFLWRTPQKGPPIKSRLDPVPTRTQHDPPGTIVQTSNKTPVESDDAVEEDTKPDASELAWRQGWKEIYALLDATERTLLFEITAQGRGEHTLGPGALKLANELVLKLDDNWKAYAESAFQSLAELKPDEQSSWEGILRTANTRWSEESRPALEAAAQGVAVKGEQLAGLARFQQTLDRLNLNLIRDDSPLRPDENDIWFRLMLRAKHTPAEQLQKEAISDVTYIQIFKQTSTYRGDLVRFRGIVRRAWRTPTVNNPWGMKDYYAVYIHPLDGPNAPIIAHLQTLPEGFPKVDERPRNGKDVNYHEVVTVTGYFFKRQAYPGADGTYTAPLLLGNELEWQPTIAQASSRFEMTLPRFLWIAAGTFIVSMLAFGFIYWRVREQDHIHAHDDDIARADLSGLKDVQLTPTVSESLQRMEREQGRQDTPGSQ